MLMGCLDTRKGSGGQNPQEHKLVWHINIHTAPQLLQQGAGKEFRDGAVVPFERVRMSVVVQVIVFSGVSPFPSFSIGRQDCSNSIRCLGASGAVAGYLGTATIITMLQ